MQSGLLVQNVYCRDVLMLECIVLVQYLVYSSLGFECVYYSFTPYFFWNITVYNLSNGYTLFLLLLMAKRVIWAIAITL